ncbi:MAG: YjbH domain-containing protein, partial [Bacteroidales bacterium]|nr:YjbH domain-containing protein [Bacteroidales bacterium]
MKYATIKLIGVIGVLLLSGQLAKAQINYGTTGLMNMPTADMQRDKTVMLGGNWLSKHATVPRWWYDTWNYYINVTIFPWLEAGYLCTGHKAVPVDYGHRTDVWVPSTYGKFVNQDRSFHFRLRLWKEGGWKSWTPQVVIGANDGIGESDSGGSLSGQTQQNYANGFWNRYYLAVTKHFYFDGIGMLGAHVSWIYSNRFDNKLSEPAVGANFRFGLKD